MTKASVAVLGLGFMGSAMAERLAALGYRVIVWNRTKSKAEKISSQLGVKVAGSVAEALGEVDAAISMVADDEALYSIVTQVPRVDGLIFINSSTITPMASLRVAEYLESRGACYVEAPVIGGPNAARKGDLVILVAGRAPCVSRARGILGDLASEVIELGDSHPTAQALKLAFNSLLIGTLGLLSEVLALVRSYEIDASLLKKILSKTVFKDVANKYLDRLLASEWPTSFRLRLASKDLNYARLAAWNKGVPMLITSVIAELFKAAEASGLGDQDYSRVYRYLEGMLKAGRDKEG